jgi:hypothetical protein
VRIPVVVNPVLLAGPAEVSSSYSVKFGYAGPFTAQARGLVAAAVASGTVVDGDYTVLVVNIPAGTTYARFSLFDEHVSSPSDLDLVVYNSAFRVVGSSGGSTAREEVNLVSPAAGTYYVLVDGFSIPAGTATFKLFSWALGSTAAAPSNMTVTAPSTAVIGATGTIGLAFTGLTPGTKYLGAVAYGGIAGLPAPTIVRVDP